MIWKFITLLVMLSCSEGLASASASKSRSSSSSAHKHHRRTTSSKASKASSSSSRDLAAIDAHADAIAAASSPVSATGQKHRQTNTVCMLPFYFVLM